MDLIQAEISRKRKHTAEGQGKVSAAERERLLEEQAKLDEAGAKRKKTATTQEEDEGMSEETHHGQISSEKQRFWVEVSALSMNEVASRLRAHGEAIALFGEKEDAKRGRLVSVMLDKSNVSVAVVKEGQEGGWTSATSSASTSKNIGKTERRREDKSEEGSSHNNNRNNHNNSNNNTSSSKSKKDEEEDVGVCTHYSDDLERFGPEKVIFKYFKNLLHQWEADLARRSSQEVNSAKGRADSNSYANAKEQIKSLFALCKRKEIPPDIRAQVLQIVKCCEEGDFRAANDHYLQAAIGNAAWPIGVTSVGIHQRSGRERLNEGKVAHVMNNEMQRKYFTSVKRLMTYAQSKRPDVAPSMKVLH